MTPAEINEAVARKFGWTRCNKEEEGEVRWHYDKPLNPKTFGGQCRSELPDYCGSIQAAFELLSHFDYLEITKGKKTDWLVKSGTPECSYAKTLPEAICLAFLRL